MLPLWDKVAYPSTENHNLSIWFGAPPGRSYYQKGLLGFVGLYRAGVKTHKNRNIVETSPPLVCDHFYHRTPIPILYQCRGNSHRILHKGIIEGDSSSVRGDLGTINVEVRLREVPQSVYHWLGHWGGGMSGGCSGTLIWD